MPFHITLGKTYETRSHAFSLKPPVLGHDHRPAQLGEYLQRVRAVLAVDPMSLVTRTIANVVRDHPYQKHEHTYVSECGLEVPGANPRQDWCFVIIKFNIDEDSNDVYVHGFDIKLRKRDS